LMQKMRQSMPVAFTLSDVACKHLLDFYYDKVPTQGNKSKALGAMGYEWLRLNLLTLHHEYTYLLEKAKHEQLSTYEIQRQEDIKNFINQHEGIAKVSSQLQSVPVYFPLPDGAAINISMISQTLRNGIYNNFDDAGLYRDNQLEAMQALRPNMSDNDFIKHFNDYWMISKTKDNLYRKQLLDFCKATLLANRHVHLSLNSSNLYLLSNVLYRVLCSEEELPPHVNGYKSLIRYAKQLDTPCFDILQLVDTTNELLMRTQDLWLSFPTPSRQIIPTFTKDGLCLQPFKQSFSPELKDIMQKWSDESKIYRTGDVASLCYKDEYDVGDIKYQSLCKLKHMAIDYFDDAMIKYLIKKTSSALEELARDQEQLGQMILNLAQNGPKDPVLKQRWDIDVEASKRAPLDMPQMLMLYFHQDTIKYKEETGLSDEDIEQFHALLIKYVAQGLHSQQHARVKEQLDKLEKHETKSGEHFRAKYLLAQALFTENLISVVDDPGLSLFQLHENILLRPQQKETLDRLLTLKKGRYDEVVEKIIMGGGKSKVILPIIAQKKSDGHRLVVIAFPSELLQTNSTDLRAISSNASVNQGSYTFEFSRESGCSASQLEIMYQALTDVRLKYVVTNKDALLSFKQIN
jgi:hypothetical protein